jgi:hypothetical protein
LYQIGFVVAWTIVTALFVEQFGIRLLPFLFFFRSGFDDYWIFDFWISSFSNTFILFSSIYDWRNIVFLCGAFFFPVSSIFFFTFLILAKGLFFSQLSIGLYRRTETLFSTSQAQRFFSFIESSITVGALLGALITLLFLSFLPTSFVLIAWALALVCMFYIIFVSPRWLSVIPRINPKSQEHSSSHFVHAFKTCIKIPFLRVLGVILILQAFVFTVIEIDFTHSVYSHIPTETHHSAIDFSLPDFSLHASLFSNVQTFLIQAKQGFHEEIESLSSILIMNESLAHDLGMFHLIFAFFALLFQIFITPKALQKFGIIRTFMSYFFALFFFFGSFIFGFCFHFFGSFNPAYPHILLENLHIILAIILLMKKSRESLRLFF